MSAARRLHMTAVEGNGPVESLIEEYLRAVRSTAASSAVRRSFAGKSGSWSAQACSKAKVRRNNVSEC